ncbi:DNA breaking-rejoining enzyme [Mycena galericulata]|nr:DNA breaking-rejoining enzyme [Mycena galericulata]
MRTDNPLLSPGYFVPRGTRRVFRAVTIEPNRIPSPPDPSSRHKRRLLPRPSHKRHATPRIFQPFRTHITSTADSLRTNLSQRVLNSVDFALQHGWAEATLSNYGTAVDRFLAFCTTEGVPEHLQLPADEFVLCAFAASGAGVHAGSTARNNIAALKAWHIAQNAPWNGGSRLHYVLAGVENLAPESAKRPPRPPINAAMLCALYDGLDFSIPKDVAVFAAACVAFWGQCRLGEILPTSSLPKAWKYLPTRHHLSRASRNRRATTLRLPRTKTKINGEDVVLVSQSKPLDPRIALDMHLLANHCDENMPLFTYSTSGRTIILTKAKFLERCNEIWGASGYPRTTGHSSESEELLSFCWPVYLPTSSRQWGGGLLMHSTSTGAH